MNEEIKVCDGCPLLHYFYNDSDDSTEFECGLGYPVVEKLNRDSNGLIFYHCSYMCGLFVIEYQKTFPDGEIVNKMYKPVQRRL